MLNLIINADDFGFDENRTTAILQAFAKGVLSTTTAMANMPYFPTAMRKAREAGVAQKIGLHFNITEGPALTKDMKSNPFFCDENGCFKTDFHHKLVNRMWLSARNRRCIAGEARAQIDSFLKNGGSLRHFDSHHHIHTDISVMMSIRPVLKEFDFRTVRLSRNIGNSLSICKRLYKSVFNFYLTRTIRANSDFFGSFMDVKSALYKLPTGSTVEVMLHPLFGRWNALDITGPFVDSTTPMKDIENFLRENIARVKIVSL